MYELFIKPFKRPFNKMPSILKFYQNFFVFEILWIKPLIQFLLLKLFFNIPLQYFFTKTAKYPYFVSRAWIVIGSAFGSIFVLFAMFVHAYTVPLNYFLLAAWTVLQAITIGAISNHSIMLLLFQLFYSHVLRGRSGHTSNPSYCHRSGEPFRLHPSVET